MQQLDIAGKDAVRLQREVFDTAAESDPIVQKFEQAASEGDPGTVRVVERATIGALYIRPVKKPVFTPDGVSA